MPGLLRVILGHILYYCQQHDLPPLTSLVVNQETGLPGAGIGKVVRYGALADGIAAVSRKIQKMRWQTRLASGFDPRRVSIPKRFTENTTWKGKLRAEFLSTLQDTYARCILELTSGVKG